MDLKSYFEMLDLILELISNFNLDYLIGSESIVPPTRQLVLALVGELFSLLEFGAYGSGGTW